MDEEDMAEWLVMYIGTHYSDAFVRAANSLGFPTKAKKMDAATAATMWEEANVSIKVQCIIQHHLHCFFRHRVVAPKKKIDKAL